MDHYRNLKISLEEKNRVEITIPENEVGVSGLLHYNLFRVDFENTALNVILLLGEKHGRQREIKYQSINTSMTSFSNFFSKYKVILIGK